MLLYESSQLSCCSYICGIDLLFVVYRQRFIITVGNSDSPLVSNPNTWKCIFACFDWSISVPEASLFAGIILYFYCACVASDQFFEFNS